MTRKLTLERQGSFQRENKLFMVVSDWEGPWVTADHAFEVTKRCVPNGDMLFAGISEYDDYLSYVKKKEGYQPGDTLALIAPFLVAYDVNEKSLTTVAKENANFIKGSLEAIRMLGELGYSLKIVSTSYCQYVWHTTNLAGIPKTNTKCTFFPIDEYSLNIEEKDKEFVKEKVNEITSLPKLGITASTTEKELPLDAMHTIKKLDRFFWEELPKTSYKQMLEEVKPIGGYRKFMALEEALAEEHKALHQSETIGDSITDWVMLKKTKDAGGLSISFNGNDYALKNSNVAIISNNCMVTPVIIDLFNRAGIESVEEVTSNWNYNILKEASAKGHLNLSLFMRFLDSIDDISRLPRVAWITEDNIEATINDSKKMRNTLRGVAIGSLG